jgi:hypothetical protein
MGKILGRQRIDDRPAGAGSDQAAQRGEEFGLDHAIQLNASGTEDATDPVRHLMRTAGITIGCSQAGCGVNTRREASAWRGGRIATHRIP